VVSSGLTKPTYTRYLIPVPNVISKDRRSVTFLESRKVAEWMEAMARERGTDLSVILREATSAYYLQHHDASLATTLTARRAIAKAAQRSRTARQIKAGVLSPLSAQSRNAPVTEPVRVLDLWSSIRRHVREKSV
jgi:hypothetical protein